MDIVEKVSGALKWVAASRIFIQLFSWISTIVVIRLLSPEDYGLMALASATIAIFQNVSEMGMESALVQRQNLTKRETSQVFSLVLLTNVTIFLILYLGSEYFSILLGDKKISPILQLLSTLFLVNAFSVVPRAILRREMAFKPLSLIGLLTSLCGISTTLLMALSGYGVWSLVFGTVVGSVVNLLCVLIYTKAFIIPTFRLQGVAELLSFGGYVTLDRIIWSVYSQADTFIIGRLLGNELLGIYSVAKELATIPMSRLASILNPIAFSAFSRVQNQKDKIGGYFSTSVKHTATLTFPIFLGISSVAPELVEIALGEQWLGSIVPLQIICLVVPMKMLVTLIPPALMGIGKASVNIKHSCIALILIPGSIYFGTNFGINGAAFAWLIAYPVYFLLALKIVLPEFNLTMGRYFSKIKWALFSSCSMYLTVIILRNVVGGNFSALFDLILLILIGAVTYLSLLWWCDREELMSLKKFIIK